MDLRSTKPLRNDYQRDDNLNAICEPIVYMREPLCLTTLSASTAYYRDRFTHSTVKTLFHVMFPNLGHPNHHHQFPKATRGFEPIKLQRSATEHATVHVFTQFAKCTGTDCKSNGIKIII
jgi:hypothetical protein